MPVEPTVLLAFIVASGAVVLSPGPDTILILRYTMSSGQRVGLATVAGVQLGLAAHTLLAIFGITVIIVSSPILFKSVALAGAAYLAWLGLQSFRAGANSLGLSVSGEQVVALTAARRAFITNLLNPKVIILYLALMPNFIDLEKGTTGAQLFVLGAVLIIVNIIWQVPMALAADKARQWLDTPSVQKWMSWSTGVILLFFAAAMIWSSGIKH